jgi:hypothetical protein
MLSVSFREFVFFTLTKVVGAVPPVVVFVQFAVEPPIIEVPIIIVVTVPTGVAIPIVTFPLATSSIHPVDIGAVIVGIVRVVRVVSRFFTEVMQVVEWFICSPFRSDGRDFE